MKKKMNNKTNANMMNNKITMKKKINKTTMIKTNIKIRSQRPP